MTQSKDDYTSIGDITFDVTEGSLSPFTLNADTTVTIGGEHISDIYSYNTATNTISDIITLDNVNITWPLADIIDVEDIKQMCKEYPALQKTWRNFKTTYDLVLQDWKGKQNDEDTLF
jgi:hypothetical protein